MSTTKDLTAMSVKELEEVLATKKKAEADEARKKRSQYEKNRETMIDKLGKMALEVYNSMFDLKQLSFAELAAFKEQMREYGDLRRGEQNKGSFEVKNDNYKIQFSSQVVRKFDERATMAEEKMNIFLTSFVKRKDAEAYELISSLMKRKEETGEFDHDMISRLYAIEDKFDDKNWKAALKLFRESYVPTHTAQYVRFSIAKEGGGFDSLVLDFAKIKI